MYLTGVQQVPVQFFSMTSLLSCALHSELKPLLLIAILFVPLIAQYGGFLIDKLLFPYGP